MHTSSLMHFQQPEKSAFCAKAHFHLCVEHSMAAGGPDLVIGVCSQSRLQLCSPRKPPVVPVPVVPPWHPRAVLPSRVTASGAGVPVTVRETALLKLAQVFLRGNRGSSSDQGQLVHTISPHFSQWKHLNSSVESESFPWKLRILKKSHFIAENSSAALQRNLDLFFLFK